MLLKKQHYGIPGMLHYNIKRPLHGLLKRQWAFTWHETNQHSGPNLTCVANKKGIMDPLTQKKENMTDSFGTLTCISKKKHDEPFHVLGKNKSALHMRCNKKKT